MKPYDALRAWGRILTGYRPILSLEITRECPLRCPGCYAYEPDHLNGMGPLRSVADHRGDELVARVLELVRQHRPIHVSIVGGEPLVRYRELDVLLPKLGAMGIEVQLVTSAVRPIPHSWRDIAALHLSVSIDGLQPEHDVRRAPATYERILKHIQGHQIVVHCTITRQMTGRPGYFEEFLEFWSEREEARKIWFSLFTPQVGEQSEEILSTEERERVLLEIAALRPQFPKLQLPDGVINAYLNPPHTPEECIFAQTTLNFTADMKSQISPCQFGGNPSCSECGCMASAGFQAIGDHRLLGVVPLRSLFHASGSIGKVVANVRH